LQTIEAIMNRRSIRLFDKRPVNRDDLRELVTAAAHAASGGNRQNWRFIAVSGPEQVRATTENLGWLNSWYPPEEKEPRAHVVVLAPADASPSILSDCAAAAQNLLVAAWARGIGGCWFGSVKREVLTGILGIPDEWKIFCVLALGYPAEEARVVEPGADGSVRVFRSEDGTVLVPKKPLDQILSFDSF